MSENRELARILADARRQDLLLGAMVGVVLAWQLTNQLAYAPDGEPLVLRFVIITLVSLALGTGLTFRLVQNWRRHKYYRR